ncbi:DUF4190 domain-containing protein [Streptomyces himalayensis]|uniref:DUF4190 domain-containing protein n=1 Tax=Streptomyces himalayensis subsp. himalayensis TaxID=2756131 RepID=A0A7W0DGY5_9ACTN|nr:DUF4190 domain-containing protein [Streptomyces himalayensis]MBA2944830.1 DUF4190 domain-containing protein [Streptomyces himalayensis subsp. himalayensis]
MTENDQHIPGDSAPRDPWAPPAESDPKVALGKPQQSQRPQPLVPPQGGQAAPIHEQETLVDGREGGSFAPVAGGPGWGPVPGTGPAPGSGPVPGPGPGPFPGPGDAVPPVPPAPGGPDLGYGGLPPYPESSRAAAQGYGGYGYPGYGYPGYGWPGMPAQPRNGMGIAALVLGILSVCLFCLYGVVSVVLGVLALIFGLQGRKLAKRGEATNSGMAVAGIVTGSVGIVLGMVIVGLLIWGFSQMEQYEESGESDPFSTSLIVGSGR